MGRIRIYTDGACQGNPGPGSWKALIERNGDRQEIEGKEEQTTNQRMELLAVIKGLQRTNEGESVEVHSASEYVVNGAKGLLKRSKNLDLWKQLDELLSARKISWMLESKSKIRSATPSSGEPSRQTLKARNPANGFARYQNLTESARKQIQTELVERFQAQKGTEPNTEWSLLASEGANQVRANMYPSGVLLIQGRTSELWDRICTVVEALLSPELREVASRFISQSAEQAERFETLFTPKLTSLAEREVAMQLAEAYDFLEDQDKRYATTAFCLYLAKLELPEYSVVVMPLSKAFEGYLKKLTVFLNLATRQEVDSADNVGPLLDRTRPQVQNFFKLQTPTNKGMLKMLVGELSFSRHFLMHSNALEAVKVGNSNEARQRLERLADSVKRSHKALVLNS